MMTDTLSPRSIVQRRKDLLDSRIEDELVMLDVEGGMYYALESIGTWIWEQIGEPRSIESLCAATVERFDVDVDTCRNQLIAFLAHLQTEGLLVVREDS